jgi:hypothetical protein
VTTTTQTIRDRIVELRRVPASSLRPSPWNWRVHPKGQQDALRGVLSEIGFAGAELARELPDGTLELIDGHCRAEIMGDSPIPVLVLDVNEQEAKTLVATFDPLAAMSGADAGKLDALLKEIETSQPAIEAMLADLAKSAGIASSSELSAPGEFPEVDENLPTEHTCPKCGYQWSGGK